MNIKLNNVRLSFPSLFKRETFEGKEGKYAATFLISKDDTKTKALLDKAIEECKRENKLKVPADRICLRDGDESEYEGYEGCWSLKASSVKRPTVVNRDRTPLTEDDEVLYPGCYVNAIVNFWGQNNSFGKRINANLIAVQFVEDGDAFGAGGTKVDPEEVFDDLEMDTSDL